VKNYQAFTIKDSKVFCSKHGFIGNTSSAPYADILNFHIGDFKKAFCLLCIGERAEKVFPEVTYEDITVAL